jgi:hypothetical protein
MTHPDRSLRTDPRLDDPDGLYESLVAAHEGLDAEQSAALDIRLVLLLANHIGDTAVVVEAIRLARTSRPNTGDALEP